MRLPVTILSGYLGAGKTTLVNRLLAEDHGLRVAVLVNDFGAVNIDAGLIDAGGEDMIALTNGCVCCSMESDLLAALGAVLDRDPRPDHVVIEASGIADPAALAAAVTAERELSYAGIVTLVDADTIGALLEDDAVAGQVCQQIAAADLVLVTKTPDIAPELAARLAQIGRQAPALLPGGAVSDLLFDVIPLPRARPAAPHAHYAAWSHQSDAVLDRHALGEKLIARPAGLYRLKGHVVTEDGAYEIHVVGQYVDARRAPGIDRTVLVGLGPADRVSVEEIEAWWRGSA